MFDVRSMSVRSSINDVRVRSMFDKMVFNPSLLTDEHVRLSNDDHVLVRSMFDK